MNKHDGMFVVDCVRRSGGLVLLWKEEVQVTIQNYSRRHINAIIKLDRDGVELKFTGFYGHLEVARRKEA
jgi:endonuclease/exonuclease/phosphatase family metal-dependent hydrolase